jgi:hypothetical protein
MANGKESSSPRRYIVAGFGLALVIALTGLVTAASRPDPVLPKTSPRRLVASVASALLERRPVSGSVSTHLDLGISGIAPLPESSGLSALLGDQRLRVWSSPHGLRVTQILPFGERSLIVGPKGVWTWDSESFSAHRLAGPEGAEAARKITGWLSFLDPAEIARAGLEGLTDTTEVSLGSPRQVAGRDAYTLHLQPRSDATLVKRITVSIDARTRVPLAVEVLGAAGGRPPIFARFDSVSFDPIPRSTFTFSPPPGATVEEGWDHDRQRGRGSHPGGFDLDRDGRPRIFGRGWTSVVAIPLPEEAARALARNPVLKALTPYSGPLLSADIVEAGARKWLVYGAVPLRRVERVGSRLR